RAKRPSRRPGFRFSHPVKVKFFCHDGTCASAVIQELLKGMLEDRGILENIEVGHASSQMDNVSSAISRQDYVIAVTEGGDYIRLHRAWRKMQMSGTLSIAAGMRRWNIPRYLFSIKNPPESLHIDRKHLYESLLDAIIKDQRKRGNPLVRF
ncbi:MAG: hypothetical protein ABII00_05200, partial [Elusimicrobiota bacterium]